MAKTLGTEQHKALIAMLIAKREVAGITQAELAKALGEYQSFIARLESGQRRVDVIELIQIANILGFTASQIVKEIELMGQNANSGLRD
jgi:transcriptional regulator with XRE-family HTH domain